MDRMFCPVLERGDSRAAPDDLLTVASTRNPDFRERGAGGLLIGFRPGLEAQEAGGARSGVRSMDEPDVADPIPP